jgi:phospholipase/carboxylesterase
VRCGSRVRRAPARGRTGCAHDCARRIGSSRRRARGRLQRGASTGPTWDVVLGGFGADVARIDRALRRVFRRCSVDPDRIAVAGFSDGASYALSLGLANGDLFRHVIAFSPGFIAPAPAHGMPTVFISHGTRDPVLPIEQTSRRIVPDLRRAGYDVRYREFDAGHAVLPALVRAAITRAVAR